MDTKPFDPKSPIDWLALAITAFLAGVAVLAVGMGLIKLGQWVF